MQKLQVGLPLKMQYNCG